MTERKRWWLGHTPENKVELLYTAEYDTPKEEIRVLAKAIRSGLILRRIIDQDGAPSQADAEAGAGATEIPSTAIEAAAKVLVGHPGLQDWEPLVLAGAILKASGLPADLQAAQERARAAEEAREIFRDDWKRRAEVAEAEVHRLARELGAAEASGWPGVVGEWRRRALKAETVIEKARSRKKGVLVQMYDDDIEALTSERDEAIEARAVWLETATAAKAERDQLASQVKEARWHIHNLLAPTIGDTAHTDDEAAAIAFLSKMEPKP